MDILDRISILLEGREQKELTDYLGLKSAAFSEWKSGKSKSFRKYLIEIAEFFGVSIDYLVYGKTQATGKNAFSEAEETLLCNYHTLSKQGQEYIQQQMLIAKQIYPKENQSKTDGNNL